MLSGVVSSSHSGTAWHETPVLRVGDPCAAAFARKYGQALCLFAYRRALAVIPDIGACSMPIPFRSGSESGTLANYPI
jgi:hypothetical protein